MIICTNAPIPNIQAILSTLLDKIPFPPHLPGWPSLPSFPNPLFPGFSLPNLEMITMALELQAMQLQNTIMNMIKPMLDFLGIDLLGWLPKIPGIAMSIIDLIAGSPDAIVGAIKNAIEKGFRWPSIPWPLFPKFSLPSLETIQLLQMIVADYMAIVVSKIPSLIKSVVDKLKIGMPSFPTLPTKEQVLAAIVGLVPGVADIADLINGFRDKIGDAISMLSNLSFPGLPSFSIPWPLIPNFRLPDFEFNFALTAFITNLTTGLMNSIMDFIQNTLKRFLGFSFPTFCITL